MARKKRLPLPVLILLFVLLPIVLAAIWIGGALEDEATALPYSAPLTRAPLTVTVVEKGALEALRSTTIRSEVEGDTKILELVPEGTVLTESDVAEGRVLVRLNDASIVRQIKDREEKVNSAKSSWNAARVTRELQEQQNASDVRQAALAVHFAMVDLRRYLGEDLFESLEAERQADKAREARLAAEREAALEAAAAGETEGGPSADVEMESAEPPLGEDAAPSALLRSEEGLAQLLEDPRLDGEARQKMRQLESDIQLAEEELKRARTKLEGSLQLLEKGYVSQEDVELDRLTTTRRQVELEQAMTARSQFRRYDFPKEVQKLSSALIEADATLARTHQSAAAALDRARVEEASRKRHYDMQVELLAHDRGQRDLCVIRATVPGLVVYASSGGGHWRQDDAIEEGKTVRQRQALITIPDPRSIGVRLSVHETAIKLVEEGQRAFVTVDAYPDEVIEAEVVSVGMLPMSVNRWLNPDLKVYETKLRLIGSHPQLKPGMNCRVEIRVAEMQDVLQVPVQAVGGTVAAPTVWVETDEGPSPRAVELGLSNDRQVQILSGLSVGERVLLAPDREGLRRKAPEEAEEAADGEGEGA